MLTFFNDTGLRQATPHEEALPPEYDPSTCCLFSLLNLNGHSIGILAIVSFVVKDQFTHVARCSGTHDSMSGIRRKGNALPGPVCRIWSKSGLAVELQDRSRCNGYRAVC